MVGSQAHLSAPGPWSMRVPVLREGRDARGGNLARTCVMPVRKYVDLVLSLTLAQVPS